MNTMIFSIFLREIYININNLFIIFLNSPPPIPTSKTADSGIFQVFECSDGELEYEQDVPG
jgi:hypothetical protein